MKNIFSVRNFILIANQTIVMIFLLVACSKSGGSSYQGGGGTNPPPTNPKVPAPAITSISPDTATVTTTVTINGTNFDTNAANDTVQFSGATATPTKASATQLTVALPAKATTGNVVVKTPGGASNALNFIVIVANTPTIYVLGNDIRQGTGYWTNSTFTPITDNTSVYDIKGSGSDIYIAGPCVSNTPTYWKNGVAVHLSVQTGYTWSIFVSGADVYNLGLIGNTFYVWKNGTPTQLTTTSLITDANQTYYRTGSLFVYNGDTYVAGSQYLGTSTISKATYWKNGVAVDLTDGINTGSGGAWASAIAVSNGDVYVAGIEVIRSSAGGIITNAPRLWKNGASIPITAATNSLFTSVTSLLVNGSDVYVAGQYNNAGAVWKNGALIDSANYAVAEYVSSLFLYNNTDLYFSGASSVWGENGYWKNGNFVEMDPGCGVLSSSCANTSANQVSGIYVK